MAHEIFPVDDDLPEADRHLLMTIRKALLDYEPLRATRPTLEVTVRDGLAHVRGRVRTSAIKEIAEFLMLRVPGIRAVRNELVADPEVVRAVADAFAADGELGPACPIVDARDGAVVLAGTVPSDDLVRRAIEVASAVPTVVSVTSHLQVRAPAPAMSTNGTVAVASADGQGSA
jgi:osmotically-inducible protein OsmY